MAEQDRRPRRPPRSGAALLVLEEEGYVSTTVGGTDSPERRNPTKRSYWHEELFIDPGSASVVATGGRTTAA